MFYIGNVFPYLTKKDTNMNEIKRNTFVMLSRYVHVVYVIKKTPLL